MTGDAPKRRGRPPGTKNKPKESEPVVETFAPPTVPAATPVHVSTSASDDTELADARKEISDLEKANARLREQLAAKSSTPAAEGISLFVDALPAKGTATNLDEYVGQITGAICAQFKIEDVRYPLTDESNQRLGFGKWKGALAALVRSSPPPAGQYFILTRGNEVNEVVAATLAPLATLVVKGV